MKFSQAILLALTLLVVNPLLILPARAGIWATNSPMSNGRQSHTATLLSNGQVLVAGGFRFGGLTGAELYDPATGAWTNTGSLATGRWGHTATLLPNGKVLVAGGFSNSGSSTASAELYDPATGTWTNTGAMTSPRRWHTATLLPNGQVLVAGGWGSSAVTNSAELYDPATGTWTNTGAMDAARMTYTATLLPNGQVLVAGGYGGGYLAGVELFNPATGTWTNAHAMTGARYNHTATLLPNGLLLVAGGGGTATAELFNPAANSWTATGTMTAPRENFRALLLPNGQVLAAGGDNSGGYDGIATVDLYDPASGAWTNAAPMSATRYNHTATLLASGRVLVAGGFRDSGSSLSTTEVYDPAINPATGAWTNTGSLNIPRYMHTATLLPGGQVLGAGGFGSGDLNSAELFNPNAGTWSVTGSLNTARYLHTASLLPGGNVLVAGGYNGPNSSTSAELFNPDTGKWTVTGSLNDGRLIHTATLLPNGQVLVAGGDNFTGVYPNGFVVLSSTELYDPATGTWTRTGPLNAGRGWHTATLLPNGKVLVAGGSSDAYRGSGPDGYTPVSSAEIYDPAAGTWSPATAMTAARVGHTATLLPNGKVLVAGGNGAWTNAEIFDPAAGTWTPTGSMNIGRASHTATLLPDGKVLVTGGVGAGAANSTESYDPATGIWTLGNPMTDGRAYQTATLLPNGKLLVAGGAGSLNVVTLSSAELYAAGQNFHTNWQPQITSLTSPLALGGSLSITGTQFRGVTAGSGGNFMDSAADHPVVQLRHLDSGRTAFLSAATWSASSFASTTVTNFPPGWAMATVFVNGIPGPSSILSLVKGTANVTLTNLVQIYDGNPKSVAVITVPPGLATTVTYNGSTNPPAALGTYLVVGTVSDPNYQGGATNTLTISPLAPTIITQPASQIAPPGSNVTFTVAATGLSPLSYQWYFNGRAVGGATATNYILTGATATNAGSYTVVVTNLAGSVTSSPAVLLVGLPPTMILNGAALLTNGCDTSFTDPGATAYALPPPPRAVSAGAYHGLALTAAGLVVGWGLDDFGEIDPPAEATNVVAISAGGYQSMALRADGSVVNWGLYNGGIVVPESEKDITAIAAGYSFSMVLKADRTVAGWGEFEYGYMYPFSVPTNATNVVAIAAGYAHCLALKTDGSVMGWGDDTDGQTDIPANVTNVIAISAGAAHSLALRADGTVIAWGNNSFGRLTVPPDATNIVAISAGGLHSLALRADGRVFAWGWDAAGQTDIPPNATNVVEISAGYYDSLVKTASGLVIGWGGDYYGQSTVPVWLNTNYLAVMESGSVDTNTPGTYTLTYTATDTTGVSGTVTRQVVMPACPPAIDLPPADQLVEKGAGATFSVSASGTAPLHYQWRKLVPFNTVNLTDGGNLSGSATANLVLTNIGTNDASLYDVIITNGYGSITSSVASLTLATRVIALTGSLAFGNVQVGNSAQRSLAICNQGNSPLTVSNLNCPAGFSGSLAPATIPPGGSNTVTITFTPVTATVYGGSLTVSSDANGGSPAKAVSGTGTTGTRVITLYNSLDFGNVPVGATAQRILVILNSGNSTMTVSGITCPGGFSGDWAGTIAPGGTAGVTVSFTPTTLTTYGGALTVNSDANSGTKIKAVAGVGVAAAPQLTLLPQGTNVVMSWPTNNAAGYVLEYATNLAGTGWMTNPRAPAIRAGQYILTNGTPGGARFYRLNN